MRVVSLVPSWTETLLWAGVDVVGRTRFCVHPKEIVDSIAAVGGTKDWDIEKIRALNPDILILDQEENPKWMSEQSPCRWHATHIVRTANVADELRGLSEVLGAPKLAQLAERWTSVLRNPVSPWAPGRSLPGVLEWGKLPEEEVKFVLYVIWKKPWMVVDRNTFIGSVLSHCGLGGYLAEFPEKYPKVELSDWDPKHTLLLFSSEPYPFLKHKAQIPGFWSGPYAVVDGESFSWFGIRSLQFLESLTCEND